MLIVSTGCPASIGPEISLHAASQMPSLPVVLVGDWATLRAAARLRGIAEERLQPLSERDVPAAPGLYVVSVAPELAPADRVPGKPSARSGAAQLAYIEAGYALAKRWGAPLVTAPVSKSVIAHSGTERAAQFRGHTEWLEALDGARDVTMCFYAPQFSSSLVTTHLPLRSVAQAVTALGVQRATVDLAEMLLQAGYLQPTIAVASLNPHAGEGELLGDEERLAIAPGIVAARAALQSRATVVGPVGAETAFRLAGKGTYHAVVAMYHDQATIPMKLISFGDAVNVTMGLSIVRTSVDHGTAYDIAWQGIADSRAMLTAMQFAARLAGLAIPAN
jgi:4-phospho-D-threonate 3-dehydrogenase / 4-phospho-D-erythronate 3-dehydrogenase